MATATSILVCRTRFLAPELLLPQPGRRIAAGSMNGIVCQPTTLPPVPGFYGSLEQSMASANAAVTHGLPESSAAAGDANPHPPSVGKLLSPNNSARHTAAPVLV
jgi:hypothetical protein